MLTMMKVVLLCVVALFVASSCSAIRISDALWLGRPAADGQAPWFCHGIDCPRFRILESNDRYEVREYPSGEWASTVVEDGFTIAMTRGFARLFQYISGANVDKQKVAMTAPVATRIRSPDAFKTASKNYTVAFFVPFDFQGKAPKPSSDDVRIVKVPKKTAYVSQFGGYATESSLLKEAATLAAAVQADGHKVKTDGFFWAGYDPPYRITGRHNEVWLAPADDEEQSAS